MSIALLLHKTPVTPTVQPVRVRLDVPDGFRPKAEYGIRMLLLPFRTVIEWVDDPAASVDVYYGRGEEAAHRATLGVVLRDETVSWFTRQHAPFPPHRDVHIGTQQVPVCFNAGGRWEFDPVASTLFLLSGWQEVLVRTRDQHGRFPYSASFQAHVNAPRIPIVDWIRQLFSEALRAAGKPLEKRTFGDNSWAFCATHDVDYDRKWRLGIRKRELIDRALLNQAGESIPRRVERARRAIGSFFSANDPFRTALMRIEEELEARRARGTFFYKAAAHGFRDVDYPLEDAFLQSRLRRQLHVGHEAGLHPSYHSFAHPVRLAQEKRRLETAAHTPVSSYRAHYLRHDHPASIHHLESAGFTLDSTLGWAQRAGYRFGTCLPFPLFDPVTDQESAVWEVPLLVMESALFNRQHLSTEEALEETRTMMDTCRALGGVFTGLWHTTLWDESDYPGWGAHFEGALDHAHEHGARMDTLSAVLESWS